MLNRSEYIRTPYQAFTKIPNLQISSKFVNNLHGFEDLRLHYLKAGPKNNERAVVCLHGQPTWSFIYRKMIPIFANAGEEVFAPDFFGFGKSDKPLKDRIYTFNFHRNTLISFINELQAKKITLVVQDWGGILGLTLPMEYPNRIDRLIIMNTTLGSIIPLSNGFHKWRQWVATNPHFQISKLMKRSCPHLSVADLAAYDAPFPNSDYRAGVRTFPELIPTSLDSEGAKISIRAANFLKNNWNGKSFMAIGAADPVFGPKTMMTLSKIIRSSSKPLIIENGGHFLQEWGEDVAVKALKTF